jgi:hypothetical protein
MPMKIPSDRNYQVFVAENSGNRPFRFNIFDNKNGGIGANFQMYIATSNSKRVALDTLPLNEWAHLVAVLDGSYLKLYHNGVLVDQEPLSYKNIPAWDGKVYIGGSMSSRRHFTGGIDELRIYNRALSVQEIGQINQFEIRDQCNSNSGTVNLTGLWSDEIFGDFFSVTQKGNIVFAVQFDINSEWCDLFHGTIIGDKIYIKSIEKDFNLEAEVTVHSADSLTYLNKRCSGDCEGRITGDSIPLKKIW